eukprot:TRINITY_DN3314_c0_g1_i2.p1 TRINITY_DN3314_c0_g1~~TRINITY_DN3314_c0_g1_i2.p1  ORF type:complete len:310 (-),score=59.05 TRINITY_DN3314_c0_g1_i2:55-984(-)
MIHLHKNNKITNKKKKIKLDHNSVDNKKSLLGSMNVIPTVVIKYILSLCDNKELCRLATVNSKWKELSEEDEFWKRLCQRDVPQWKWEYCELECQFERWKIIYVENRALKGSKSKRNLFYEGFFGRLTSKIRMRKHNPIEFAMFGLDKIGRKSILNKAKIGEVKSANPLTGTNIEFVLTKKISIVSFDVGIEIAYLPQPFWEFYVDNKDGLIFVVDSSDRERIAEAEKELFKILKRRGVRGIRLLILAHRIKSEGSMGLEELVQKLSLNKIVKRQWHIQLCCEKTGEGLRESFDWIMNIGKNKSLSNFF